MPQPESPKSSISQPDPTLSESSASSLPPPASRAEHYGVFMIAKVVVTALLAALFAFAGSIKLLGLQQSLAIRDHLGVTPARWRVIGLLELTGVGGVLVGLAWA